MHMLALTCVSLTLCQTPYYAARPWMALVYLMVCLFTPQLLIVRA